VVVYQTGEEMTISNVNIRKLWSRKCPTSNEAEKSGFVWLFHLDAWAVPILPLLHMSRHGVLIKMPRQARHVDRKSWVCGMAQELGVWHGPRVIRPGQISGGRVKLLRRGVGRRARVGSLGRDGQSHERKVCGLQHGHQGETYCGSMKG
jgi:hypothetical protein